MSTLIVASFNPGGGDAAHGGTDRDKMLDLDAAADQGFDLLGGQEFGDRHPMVYRWLASDLGTPYDIFMPQVRGAGKIPLLYRKDRLVLDAETSNAYVSSMGGWVGPEGAGPTRIQPMALAHGVFDDQETNRRIHHLNHHLVASHTRTDLSKQEQTARRALAALQARLWQATAAGAQGQVVGTGDWNAPPAWVTANAPGFIIDNTWPTQGHRQIDTVGHYESNVLEPTSEVILDTSGSRLNNDHRMPIVTYTLRAKVARVPAPQVCDCCGQELP